MDGIQAELENEFLWGNALLGLGFLGWLGQQYCSGK